MSLPASSVVERLARVRESMRLANVDALVVTHLPNLRYLTGFAGTAGLAVLTPERCVLAVDFRYVTVADELPAVRERQVAVTHVDAYDEALVALLQGASVGRIGIEAAWMPVNRFNRLSDALAAPASPFGTRERCPVLVPTERLVERERATKDAQEIATLREAARRLSQVALEVPAFVRPGRSELAVAADIDAAIRRAGFERPAFETIVASGPNSARPHARPGGRELRAGEGVVLDFGGVYDGYCVDLTRTVALGEQPEELRRLFAAVEEAHQAAIRAVRPGARASEIDSAARTVMTGHGLGEAFGHATGHGLGLEVHEEPRIGRKTGRQEDWPVQPGMVFTIEPGAYVAGVGGVRIEDDVLVTETGGELLTNVPTRLPAGR